MSTSGERGSLALGIGALLAVTTVIGTLSVLRIQQATTNKDLSENTFSQFNINSVMETTLVAYRAAEMRYAQALMSADCDQALPFYRALAEGAFSVSQGAGFCPAFKGVSVFNADNASGVSELFFYSNQSGCLIDRFSSTCVGEDLIENTTPSDTSRAINGIGFDVSLSRADSQRRVTEFLVRFRILAKPDAFETKRRFAIRGSLSNSAHLLSGSLASVVQEYPELKSRCISDSLNTVFAFDPISESCKSFGGINPRSGLALFGGRYFGLNRDSGQIIDLLLSEGSASNLVGEDGRIEDPASAGSPPIFPPYNKDNLVNVPDITVVGNAVYLVKAAPYAKIQVLDRNTPAALPGLVCDLEAPHFNRLYSGISASNWTHPDLMEPATPETVVRYGQFYLKSPGALIIVNVKRTGGKNPVIECTAFQEFHEMYKLDDLYTSAAAGGFERLADIAPYYAY